MRSVAKRALVALCAFAAAPAPIARAQPGATFPDEDPARTLLAAKEALTAGDNERAVALARPLTGPDAGARLARADRAEAFRLYGLALFFLGEHAGAEEALLELLKLDPDAVLDPTLVPPEAIVFFQDVRVRHDATIRAHRPTPRVPTRWWLNLFPPGGQLQNGQYVKGFTLLGAGLMLGTASVTTYYLARRECRMGDVFVCEDAARGRRLRGLNVASGALFAGVLAYAMIDGFVVYRRLRAQGEREALSVGVGPELGGGHLWMTVRF